MCGQFSASPEIMIHKVFMPKLGTNIESGIIQQWLKQEGDPVDKGEIIAEVETAKAVFEIESEESGILRKILVPEEEETSFNGVIAIITRGDEDISDVLAGIAEQKADTSNEYVRSMDDGVFDVIVKKETGKQRKMSPAARRLARENSISDEVLDMLGKDIIEENDIAALLGRKKVYIYGASTGAKQILEILKSTMTYEAVGIIDDNEEVIGKRVASLEVLGNFEWLRSRYAEEPGMKIMIASHSINREKIYRRVKEAMPDIEFPPIVDSRAILLSGVEVGESSLIEAGVVLGHEVIIGNNVILNLGVKISHNCTIGDHSHLAIGTCISGAVVVEENVFIGAGSAINPAVTIGKNSMISPNTAVLHDMPENVVVSGVPGKIVGDSRRGK